MKKQIRKPSRLDDITTTTVQAYAHLSSADATKRNTVLACEANVVDDEIAELASRMARARAHRAEIAARIEGLIAVVAARG